MTVLIGSWEFEGPFERAMDFRKEPGVYAILENNLENKPTNLNDDFELIELSESDNVKEALENFKNNNADFVTGNKNISAAVYYCSDLTVSLRQGLIAELLQEFEDGEEKTWFENNYLTGDFCSLQFPEIVTRTSA